MTEDGGLALAAPAYNTKRPSFPCSLTKPPARPEFPGEGVSLKVKCALCLRPNHRDECVDLGGALAIPPNRRYACLTCLDALRACWLSYGSL